MRHEKGTGRTGSRPTGRPAGAVRVDVPSTPPWFVPRRSVDAQLTRGAAGSLTVVTGPAGAGKTAAVGGWAAATAHPGPLLWHSCLGARRGAGGFWTDVRRLVARAGIVVAGSARRPGPEYPARLATALAAELAPVVLVVDDFHLAEDAETLAGLAQLLQGSGWGLRLVLVSRTDPNLGLQRHRVAGDLTEIRAADLVLGPDEVREVLAQHGVVLPEEQLAAVHDRTEGWPAGVRLAAMSLQAEPDPASFTRALAQTDRAISDYLFEEVFQRVTPPVRELLLTTSVVDTLTVGLARALAGDDALDVSALEGGTGLLQRLPDGRFRSHPLLASAARAHLQDEAPELLADLHRRASVWYAEHRDTAAALRHAAAAEDWSLVAHHVVHGLAVPRLLAGDPDDLLPALRRMPESDHARVDCLLTLAAVALADGDPPGAAYRLSEERAVRDAGSHAEATDVTDATDITEALLGLQIARRLGLVEEGLERAEQVRSHLVRLPQAIRARTPELTGMLLAGLGDLQMWNGDLDQARETLGEGGRFAGEGAASEELRRCCLARLAVLEAMTGHLGRAAELAGVAIAGTDGTDGTAPAREVPPEVDLALAWLHTDRSETEAARARLDRLTATLQDRPERLLAAGLRLAGTRLLTLTGEGSSVDLLAARPPVEPPTPWLAAQLEVAAAEAWEALGEPRQALATVAESPSPEAAVVTARVRLSLGDAKGARAALAVATPTVVGAPLDVRVAAWLVDAHLAFDEGRPDRAHLMLDRALSTSEREGIRRPFTQTGPWLRRAVRQDAQLLRRRADLVGWGPAATSVPPPRRPHHGEAGPLVTPLTDREQEVLTLLAEFLSTEEIATALFVSVNTVKTHLKSLYRKLAVARRVEAVRRGRELGLC